MTTEPLFMPTDFNCTVKRFGPEEEMSPSEFEPGDFILTHSKGLFARLIRFGQRLRYWGIDRRFTRWNHTAIIVTDRGDLVEALTGVVRTHISHYKQTEYFLVRLPPNMADSRDRMQAVAFAEFCVGERYGWVTIVSIALSMLTGAKFAFGITGQSICSGLVIRCLERTNFIIPNGDSPTHVATADLAKWFNVEPPTAKTLGNPPKPTIKFSVSLTDNKQAA
jgi:hypothetical protein